MLFKLPTRSQVHQNKKPSLPDKDPYVTITLSKECVESVLRYIKQSTIPFLLGLLLGGSGFVGLAHRSLAQPEAPTTPEVEEVSPQHKHG